MNTTHTQVTTFQIMIQKMTSIPEDFLVSPSSSLIPTTKVTTTLISNSQTYFLLNFIYMESHNMYSFMSFHTLCLSVFHVLKCRGRLFFSTTGENCIVLKYYILCISFTLKNTGLFLVLFFFLIIIDNAAMSITYTSYGVHTHFCWEYSLESILGFRGISALVGTVYSFSK